MRAYKEPPKSYFEVGIDPFIGPMNQRLASYELVGVWLGDSWSWPPKVPHEGLVGLVLIKRYPLS